MAKSQRTDANAPPLITPDDTRTVGFADLITERSSSFLEFFKKEFGGLDFNAVLSRFNNEVALGKYSSRLAEAKRPRNSLQGIEQLAIKARIRALRSEEPDNAIDSLARVLEGFLAPKAEKRSIISLPEKAPCLYDPEGETKPNDFLHQHWQPYLDAGVLHQHTLNKLDPGLKKALDKQFRRDRVGLRRLLPVKSDSVDRELEEFFGGPLPPERRAEAIKTLRSYNLLRDAAKNAP